MIISPWGEETNISIRLYFGASNNEAEYEALLLRLKASRNLGVSQAILYLDTQLAMQQCNGKFEIKNEKMMKYARALDKAKDEFVELTLELFPRTENEKTDHLARLASSMGEPPDPGLKGRELVSQLENLDDIIAEVLEGYWRYGIHKYLTKGSLDNERQFCGLKVRAWCKEMKIEQVFTSVSYPQGNGKVEVTNRTIVQALKTRLDTAGGKWVDELPSMLWSYQTTTKSGTGETPYNMVYGTEAVFPDDIGQESARIIAYSPDNKNLREMDLDLVEESRARAATRLVGYRKRMIQDYNKKVYPRDFQEGDLVMRKIEHHEERGKLDAEYEGHFKVIGKAGVATYYLEDAQGKKGKRSWKAQHLKK
ncbi:uncharacterized protein [Henckelia pumila]|uniref:uncharacterized protein n=1 Tax=Henckelia pumila TaxID=405737 RepID=UPI003C6DFE9C